MQKTKCYTGVSNMYFEALVQIVPFAIDKRVNCRPESIDNEMTFYTSFIDWNWRYVVMRGKNTTAWRKYEYLSQEQTIFDCFNDICDHKTCFAKCRESENLFALITCGSEDIGDEFNSKVFSCQWFGRCAVLGQRQRVDPSFTFLNAFRFSAFCAVVFF